MSRLPIRLLWLLDPMGWPLTLVVRSIQSPRNSQMSMIRSHFLQVREVCELLISPLVAPGIPSDVIWVGDAVHGTPQLVKTASRSASRTCRCDVSFFRLLLLPLPHSMRAQRNLFPPVGVHLERSRLRGVALFRVYVCHLLVLSLVSLGLLLALALVCCAVAWPARHVEEDCALEAAPEPAILEQRHGENWRTAVRAGEFADGIVEKLWLPSQCQLGLCGNKLNGGSSCDIFTLCTKFPTGRVRCCHRVYLRQVWGSQLGCAVSRLGQRLVQ